MVADLMVVHILLPHTSQILVPLPKLVHSLPKACHHRIRQQSHHCYAPDFIHALPTTCNRVLISRQLRGDPALASAFWVFWETDSAVEFNTEKAYWPMLLA